jgi:hypothetical protein
MGQDLLPTPSGCRIVCFRTPILQRPEPKLWVHERCGWAWSGAEETLMLRSTTRVVRGPPGRPRKRRQWPQGMTRSGGLNSSVEPGWGRGTGFEAGGAGAWRRRRSATPGECSAGSRLPMTGRARTRLVLVGKCSSILRFHVYSRVGAGFINAKILTFGRPGASRLPVTRRPSADPQQRAPTCLTGRPPLSR